MIQQNKKGFILFLMLFSIFLQAKKNIHIQKFFTGKLYSLLNI